MMFGFADLLLNTSRNLDIDNAPVLLQPGETQMCYVVISHAVLTALSMTPDMKKKIILESRIGKPE